MGKAKPKAPIKPSFILVPYEEKDVAKAAGAKWHPVAKRWYIPEGLDRAAFRWKDDYVSEPEWQHIQAKAEQERTALIKRQRHAFFKADAERSKPTRQILAEGRTRFEQAMEK